MGVPRVPRVHSVLLVILAHLLTASGWCTNTELSMHLDADDGPFVQNWGLNNVHTWSIKGSEFCFTMIGPTTGFVAVGFNSGNAFYMSERPDTVVCAVKSGIASCLDAQAFDQSMPTYDQVQNVVVIAGSESNSITTVTFKRALNTNDASDFSIPLEGRTIALLWAHGGNVPSCFSAASCSYFRHSARGLSSFRYHMCQLQPPLSLVLNNPLGFLNVVFGIKPPCFLLGTTIPATTCFSPANRPFKSAWKVNNDGTFDYSMEATTNGW